MRHRRHRGVSPAILSDEAFLRMAVVDLSRRVAGLLVLYLSGGWPLDGMASDRDSRVLAVHTNGGLRFSSITDVELISKSICFD